MEQIQVRRQAERPAMFQSTPAFSMAEDKALSAWRRRGIIETRMIFLFTLGMFVTGMIALVVLYTRTNPLPGAAGLDEGVNQENITEQSEPEVEWLTSQLGLNESQADKIRPMVDQEQRMINLAVADASLSAEQRIAKVNQIRLGTLDRLVPVLKDAQTVRLHQLRQQEAGEVRAVWDPSPETGSN
ncbi:MAG TPA: hypothetical protein VMX16_09285 [Terriglobia bacterium]|nr:hypothetical protein [Terriglobia bacterium]